MLFNSYEFIFLFLPVVLLVFFRLERFRHTSLPTLWLVLASLAFYAYWRSAYVGLLIGSIVFNYVSGLAIARDVALQRRRARWLLLVAIAADVALLGYFKYTDFLIGTVNAIADTAFPLQHVVLPLAISFFTFNQIAFLVDVYEGHVHEHGFLNYALFIVLFPHLIAGPIVHHRDIIPQFRHFNFSWSSTQVSMGLMVFSVGLFKKVVLADTVAPYADAIFDAAGRFEELTPAEAWVGALAYAMQLYFDFSGYSDMAVGGALLFGVRFPWNFDAPYKAANIIDFWRRWHISLSLFLRDYVYIRLGGNRRGALRRSWNIWLTMLIGGLWHGANWTFVLWGGLHGVYVVINHVWRDWRYRTGAESVSDLERAAAAILTFLAVTAGWVLFRSENLSAAASFYRAMIGLGDAAGGWTLEPRSLLPHLAQESQTFEPFAWIAALLAVCWLFPSLKEFMEGGQSRGAIMPWRVSWRPSRRWALGSGVLAWIAIMLLTRPTEFLYYQF
ncbi:MAG: MBOAT family protein [Methylotetracoccus sp.]|nr:MBOAT family protein [Methylotetracoccus sp.]